jgi:hypothetical protein
VVVVVVVFVVVVTAHTTIRSALIPSFHLHPGPSALAYSRAVPPCLILRHAHAATAITMAPIVHKFPLTGLGMRPCLRPFPAALSIPAH